MHRAYQTVPASPPPCQKSAQQSRHVDSAATGGGGGARFRGGLGARVVIDTNSFGASIWGSGRSLPSRVPNRAVSGRAPKPRQVLPGRCRPDDQVGRIRAHVWPSSRRRSCSCRPADLTISTSATASSRLRQLQGVNDDSVFVQDGRRHGQPCSHLAGRRGCPP